MVDDKCETIPDARKIHSGGDDAISPSFDWMRYKMKISAAFRNWQNKDKISPFFRFIMGAV